MMKKLGGPVSMQTQPGEISGPLVYLIVGAALIYLPTSTDLLINTIFQTGNSIFSGGGIDYSKMGQGSTLLRYTSSSSFSAQWADLANTLIMFLQFLGFMSFVKGWLILSKSAAPGQQPGNFAKGMTHVIGGIGLVNIVGVAEILRNTFLGQ